MIIDSYRDQFSIFLIDKNKKRLNLTEEKLVQFGFTVRSVCEFDSEKLNQILEDPPHIILQQIQSESDLELSYLENIKAKLPETKIIALSHPDVYHLALEEENFDQVVIYPYSKGIQLKKTIDQSLEYLCQLYQNESLTQYLKKMQKSDEMVHPHSKIVLMESNTLAAPINTFYELGNVQLIYKKYIEILNDSFTKKAFRCQIYWGSKKVIVIHGPPSDTQKWQGLGYSFDKWNDWDDIEKNEDLKVFCHEALGISEYTILFDKNEKWPTGFYIVSREIGENLQLEITELFYRQLLAIHALNYKDLYYKNEIQESYDCLPGRDLDDTLKKEISRSRRIGFPLSLILVSVDQWKKNTMTSLEEYLVFKSLVSQMKSQFRLTDSIYFLSQATFAVLLPHTDSKGAAIAAERFRHLICQCDFTKYVSENITVSLGLSEYPEMASDVEDLKKVAFEALDFAKIKFKGNKVVVGAAPKGFQPEIISVQTLRAKDKLKTL